MKTIFEERTFVYADKSNWPAGPWQNEVDRIQWVDSATGLDCLLTRNPDFGYLCGYVGVPPESPLSGIGYGTLYGTNLQNEDVLEITFGDFCAPHEIEEGPGVCHTAYPGRPERVYWFGFHCGNLHDLSPGLSERSNLVLPGAEYRDVAFVRENVAKLAHALARLGALSCS